MSLNSLDDVVEQFFRVKNKTCAERRTIICG